MNKEYECQHCHMKPAQSGEKICSICLEEGFRQLGLLLQKSRPVHDDCLNYQPPDIRIDSG